MIARILFIAGSLSILLSAGIAEEGVPALQVRKRMTPWGTVVERVSYYLKDGKEVEHGVQESFSPDGTIESRLRYSHGKEDGISEFFYPGIGTKQSEMSYSAGVEDGPLRTWAPDGKLLFEGTSKNGEQRDGWFEQGGTSSWGNFHRNEASWKIEQSKDGKEIPMSSREVKTSWRTWTPGKLPDLKMFIRWRWRQLAEKSSYPHMDRMPAYQEVPFLIKCFEKKSEGYEEASDQLEALTRMQFGIPWLQTDPERFAASLKWSEWWEDIGKHRPEQQKQRGVRDAEAWDLAQRGRNLPMPSEPQVIPELYELKVHFRSGDYNAVTSETLTLKKGTDGAELIRSFSTRQDGPVTEERWLPFGIKDADRVLRTLGYLIDQPWLVNDEAEIEKRYWASEKKNPESESLGKWCDNKLKGRESYPEFYYPSVDFELRDGSGKLWWNSDPDQWHGANPERFNKSHQPVPGTVFPYLAALYPESARWDQTGKPGWRSR
ncbi:hypothetical protein BH11VER1_BH11VER1_12400 [soil metagenome]